MKFRSGLAAVLAVATPAAAADKSAPAPAGPSAADWRPVDAANTVVIETNRGAVYVELAPTAAPAASEQIKKLARAHFYDGLKFFRVIDDFMDQTGDPKNDGTGQSTEPNLPPEFSFRLGTDAGYVTVDPQPGSEAGFIGAFPVVSQPIAMRVMTNDGKVQAYGPFCAGVIGVARSDAPDSGNSQFFLMRAERHSLDSKYTSFGRVVVGEEVVRAIKTGEPVAAPQDAIVRAYVLGDLPEARRPKVRVIDTRSGYFHTLVKHTIDAEGERFSICDVDVAGEIVK